MLKRAIKRATKKTLIKTLQFTALGILIIPVIFYLTLLALLEWDRIEHEYLGETKPSVLIHSKQPQKVTLLNSGLVALSTRLHLIEKAKSSIEIEYFIYELDQSAKLITQALLKKASEGVRVRVIVDFSAPIFKLNPIVAAFMKQRGVEVKYYNTAQLFRIFSVQHRSHRKLLVVDDQYVITGGRNIADDYFDISSRYNFFDSDVLIEGSLAPEFKKSFEDYWTSELALDSRQIEVSFSQESLDDAIRFLNADEKLIELKKQVYAKAAELSAQAVHSATFTCGDSTYASDYPGTGVASRQVYRVLVEESQKAQSSILIESPYFVLKGDGLKDFKALSARGIDVKVLTNTLYSTDAYYTVSAFASTVFDLQPVGLEIWGYSGKARAPSELLPGQITSTRWGLHAKRGVIDDKTSIIGTYNIDPRSANLNSEMVFICRDSSELARAISSDIQARLQDSYPIIQKNCSACFFDLLKGADLFSILRFLVFIPISSRLDFLL